MSYINSVPTEHNWDTLVAIFYFYITSDRLGFLNTLARDYFISIIITFLSFFLLLFPHRITFNCFYHCFSSSLVICVFFLLLLFRPCNQLCFIRTKKQVFFLLSWSNSTDFGLDTFCETFASVPSASIAPSEVDCQPYVEKAIKELVTSEPIGS